MFLRHVTNECQVAQGSGFALGFPWAKAVDFHWPKKWRRTTQGKIQICNMCKEQNPIVKQWSGASFSNKMFLYTRANHVICFCENKTLICTVHSQISHIQEWELRIQIFRTCFIASVHLRMRTNEPKRVLFNEQVKKAKARWKITTNKSNLQQKPSAWKQKPTCTSHWLRLKKVPMILLFVIPSQYSTNNPHSSACSSNPLPPKLTLLASFAHSSSSISSSPSSYQQKNNWTLRRRCHDMSLCN